MQNYLNFQNLAISTSVSTELIFISKYTFLFLEYFHRDQILPERDHLLEAEDRFDQTRNEITARGILKANNNTP